MMISPEISVAKLTRFWKGTQALVSRNSTFRCLKVTMVISTVGFRLLLDQESENFRFQYQW
jgi:hypothetical protein